MAEAAVQGRLVRSGTRYVVELSDTGVARLGLEEGQNVALVVRPPAEDNGTSLPEDPREPFQAEMKRGQAALRYLAGHAPLTVSIARVGDRFDVEIPRHQIERLGLRDGEAITLEAHPARQPGGTTFPAHLEDAYRTARAWAKPGLEYLA